MFEDSTHGGQHQLRYTEFQGIFISTHALTEGDITSIERNIFFNIFQLTPSRRATDDIEKSKLAPYISTHALTEGDKRLMYRTRHGKHFNSRPHGGRRQEGSGAMTRSLFQLTPSRRATRTFVRFQYLFSFQLTPSRRATFIFSIFIAFSTFQLTPSRRATPFPYQQTQPKCISTHALTEGDRACNC